MTTIRPATVADVPSLVAMGVRFRASSPYASTLGDNPAAMATAARQVIESPDGVVFVAELGGRLTGMIGLLVYVQPLSGERIAGELWWWVEPDCRGIGVRLLRQAERWATDRGAERLQMIAPTADVERLYERLGYTPVERAYQRPLTSTSRAPVRESAAARDGAPDVLVVDGVLPDPDGYRARALALPYRSVPVGPVTFHGIADCPDPVVPALLRRRFRVEPTLTFFRKSPEGQEEPNFIHTDRDMGDWTAILYLHPDPPESDGTVFWRHRLTGDVASSVANDAALRASWPDRDQWEPWQRVPAAYNRLVVFPAALFHSRAIPENYGQADDARLIQLVFGTGSLQEVV